MIETAVRMQQNGRSKLLDGWQLISLGEAGDIQSGLTLGRKIVGTKTFRVPYLRVANVKDGYLDLSEVYEIEATEAEFAKCRLQYGDLLLTEGGDPDKLGRGTFWEEQIPNCIHQNHIFRVRFDLERFSPQFLSAQLASPYGKAYFLSRAKQTTGIATINQKVLAGFLLKLPPLPEQKRIAAILNEQMTAVERARIATEAQLKAAKALPAAYLRKVFDSAEVQEWEKKALEEICQPARGITYGVVQTGEYIQGGVPTVRGGDIRNFRINCESLKRIDPELSNRFSRTILQGNEVLLAIRGSVGAVADVRPELIGANVSREVAIIPLQEGVYPQYVVYALSSPEVQSTISAKTQGAAQRGINLSDVARLKVPFPVLVKQHQIASQISKQIIVTEQVLKVMEEQLNTINKLPAAILRQAFNGEL
jgi:type I restriction enzyme S subunit